MSEIAKDTITDPMPSMEAMTAIGMKFEPASSGKVEQLQTTIADIAAVLGVATPEIVVPDQGFLAAPLTDEQRTQVASRFDSVFSHAFVALQDSLRLVTIQESGEKMVDLSAVFDVAGAEASFSDRPITEHGGEWAGRPRVFWGRRGLAERICRLITAYNAAGLMPHFEDGFRPGDVQPGLFRSVLAQPDATSVEQARSMVAVAPWIAGHMSGAAIDYTLRRRDGTNVDIGHEYLQVGASLVAMKSPFATFEQWASRQLFGYGAEMVGLTVYPGEDWHASVGDVMAAASRPKPANHTTVYGPIKDFDRQTGDIEPYDPADYYQTFAYEGN